jgi:hypothetical protein
MTDSKRQRKPYRMPLDEKWAKALLQEQDLFRELQQIRARLVEVREEAQKALDRNPLTAITAKEAARQAGRRGHPTIVITDTGDVMLEVSYTSEPKPRPKKATIERGWSSTLPTLDELRKRAAKLGIDISDLGRAKKKILARLEAGKAKSPAPASASQKSKPKMRKTAPAVGTVTVLNPKPKPAAPAPKPQDIKPGSLAAIAAQGEALVDDLDSFMASLDDIE